jgi:hypothetical protein
MRGALKSVQDFSFTERKKRRFSFPHESATAFRSSIRAPLPGATADSREIPCGNFAYRNGESVVSPLLTDRAYSPWLSIRATTPVAVVFRLIANSYTLIRLLQPGLTVDGFWNKPSTVNP